MKPEDEARREIDRQLVKCGWIVQDYSQINISAGPVAVREFPLTSGFADYLLYVDGKAIGVAEAKPVGHTLKGVETQSAKYNEGLPAGLPHFHLPLPFAYESTGKVTQFTNSLEPDARSCDGPGPADSGRGSFTPLVPGRVRLRIGWVRGSRGLGGFLPDCRTFQCI